ncbi:MAG: sel1 repeat family protein, partial [Bradyrhizobiaceae bacterium]|nr:sel1 repeat family protein [Bradyrhizobiaceae bacterium]
MDSPKRKSHWLLAAAALATVVAGADSFAQSDGEETAIMTAIDQAVRTGEFGRAATTLRKLAESGNSEAQYRLASLYRVGRGVPHDDGLAFKFMKSAAEQNHVAAQFNLGMMYLMGRGAAVNTAAAKIWLQKAASHGYDEAAKVLVPASTRLTTGPNTNARPAVAHATLHGAAEVGTPLILD